jgi:hypothetical protein
MNIRMMLSLLALSATAVLAAEVPKTTSSENATAAFERLKSLVGNWEGETPMGKVRERYELASDGHVLLEHTAVEGLHEDMITTYYVDGDKLLLTHYCSLGNQPQMQAKNGDLATGSIAFGFIGAGNLASGQDRHMHSADFKLVDNDHYASNWTLFENGKPSTKVSAQYTRVK